MNALKAKGRVWLIHDEQNKLIDNIDTDMIFHNSHLHITEVSLMGEHAFGNLKGWEDFPKNCGKGDIVIAGKNFGAGSSRQHAVDCFAALGVSVIVAESFGAIYKRNAINSGMALIEAAGILSADLKLSSGDQIEVNFETGEITKEGQKFLAKPMSKIQKDIYLAGNLFAYGKLQ